MPTVHVFDSHADWLSGRRALGFYGGSDVATIMGENPYATRFDLWAERTLPDAEAAPSEESVTLRSGHYMEPALMRWWGDEVAREVHAFFARPAIVLPDRESLLAASPDGVALARADEEPALLLGPADFRTKGEPEVLRVALGCDTKNHGNWILWDDEPGVRSYGEPYSGVVPVSIWWQVQTYCHVLGLPSWDVFAARGGTRADLWRVHYDADLMADVDAVVERFHRLYVATKKAPPVTSGELGAMSDAVRRAFPASTERVVTATAADVRDAWASYQLRRLAKVAGDAQKAVDLRLQLRMGDASALRIPGTSVDLATFKSRKDTPATTSIDWRATALGLLREIADEAALAKVDGSGSPALCEAELLRLMDPWIVRETFPAVAGSRSFLLKLASDRSLVKIGRALLDAGLSAPDDLDPSAPGPSRLIRLVEDLKENPDAEA